MVKKKILIKGSKVHDVGYRLFLMNAAEDFGIKNFDAKNVKDVTQTVVVLVESEEENINQFFDYVKTNFPENAIVSTVNIEDYDKDVKNIEAFKTSFVAAQQQKFVNVGLMLYGEVKMFRKESNEKMDKMLEKQDIMLEKMDKMLEKQDQTINVLTEIRENTSKIPSIIEKIQDLDVKYTKLEEEINKIKRAIHIES